MHHVGCTLFTPMFFSSFVDVVPIELWSHVLTTATNLGGERAREAVTIINIGGSMHQDCWGRKERGPNGGCLVLFQNLVREVTSNSDGL